MGFHFWMSASMTAWNCATLPPCGVMPISSSLDRTSLSASTAATSRFSCSTMAAGVPAGATRPNQAEAS